jgi:hypothetical protein
MDAAASPFPREDTTPPVTKRNFVFILFFRSSYDIDKNPQSSWLADSTQKQT